MSKKLKEEPFFADDILEELEKTGICVCSPICKHGAVAVIDAVTEKYPDANFTMNYAVEGLYNLFVSLQGIFMKLRNKKTGDIKEKTKQFFDMLKKTGIDEALRRLAKE